MNFHGFPLKGFPMPHYGRFPATVCTRYQSVSFIYPSQHGVQVGTFVLDHRYALGFSPSKQRVSNQYSFALCGISSAKGGCGFCLWQFSNIPSIANIFTREVQVWDPGWYPGVHWRNYILYTHRCKPMKWAQVVVERANQPRQCLQFTTGSNTCGRDLHIYVVG